MGKPPLQRHSCSPRAASSDFLVPEPQNPVGAKGQVLPPMQIWFTQLYGVAPSPRGALGRAGGETQCCSLHSCSLEVYFQQKPDSPAPASLLPAGHGQCQSSLGMMEKGTTGLLASSSRAVRKQSTAASLWPWARSTSPRPCHAS